MTDTKVERHQYTIIFARPQSTHDEYLKGLAIKNLAIDNRVTYF